MNKLKISLAAAAAAILALADANPDKVLTGSAAFSTALTEKPGIFRKLTPADLPQPFATQSASNNSHIVARPEGMLPQTLPGFSVNLFTSGLRTPRAMKSAPNGDVFLAETGASQIRVYRAVNEGKPKTESIFASGLGPVFGLAFYPPGPDPKWLYVSNITTVVRFAYNRNDLTATGKPETIITGIPSGGHSTRDLAFSPDGKGLT